MNKKALDQFESYSSQKEKLGKRKEELNRTHEKIQELLVTMEQRRFEAIDLTFKEVNKNFTEIFVKMIPEGDAHLVVKRSEASDDEDVEEESGAADYDDFVGVGEYSNFVRHEKRKRRRKTSQNGHKNQFRTRNSSFGSIPTLYLLLTSRISNLTSKSTLRSVFISGTLSFVYIPT